VTLFGCFEERFPINPWWLRGQARVCPLTDLIKYRTKFSASFNTPGENWSFDRLEFFL